jgi:carbamoyl-phosphate synthase small subunit
LSKAILALEDGSVFEGRAFGAPSRRTGEVVFNTSITGYQEIFTDPSYAGQIVILTYPEIGTYGTTPDDNEAAKPWIEALVVRELSSIASNWRSKEHAEEFLGASNIPVIAEIDTRRLVRHLRTRGVMRGVVSGTGGDPQQLVEMARSSPSMAGLDLATRVSSRERYIWTEGVEACSPAEQIGTPAGERFHVVAYDFGIKRNILRRLVHVGCRVTVVPAITSAEDVLALKPDGVFLSNGPGDPEPLHSQAAEVRALLGRTPVFGICLGHRSWGWLWERRPTS